MSLAGSGSKRPLSDRIRRSDRLTPAFLSEFAQSVGDMINLRLEVGHHPLDVLGAAWEMFETLARVHCVGEWPEPMTDAELERQRERAQERRDHLVKALVSVVDTLSDQANKADEYWAELDDVAAWCGGVSQRLTKADILERVDQLATKIKRTTQQSQSAKDG